MPAFDQLHVSRIVVPSSFERCLGSAPVPDVLGGSSVVGSSVDFALKAQLV